MSRLRHRKARRRARLLVQILDETQESLPIKIMKYYLLFSGIVVTIGLLFLEYKEKAKMKSYPIWNNIKACIYKSDKSYGVKETGDVESGSELLRAIVIYFLDILQLIEF